MAPLLDVVTTVKDGGLGLLAAIPSGTHVKIGVASAGTVNQVVEITDEAKIADFGTGPLVNALYDSFRAGSRRILAIRAQADTAGTTSAVTATKTGGGNMTVSGAPLDDFAVVVEIVDPGAKNVATFKYSLDGGDTYSNKITVPSVGTYVLPNTGLTLTFTEGVPATESFKAADQYTFTTTAPRPTVTNVNAAIDAALADSRDFEFIHLTGVSDSAMWAALDSKAQTAASSHRYIHFLAEARGPNNGETVDQWVTALVADAAAFSSTRVSVCAGRFELTDYANGRKVDRNGAALYAGRVSAIPVQRSPGRVADGPLPGVLRLNPTGISETHISNLDAAGYITFRQYIGMSGFFVTNGRIKAPAASDFQYVELRRPMDKACKLARAEALKLLQAEVTSLDDLEARLTAPLVTMTGVGEISTGRVVIPRDQNILTTGTLRAKIRITPVAIARSIELEVGYEIPKT